MKVTIVPIEERHNISIFLTDNRGHQHEMMGKLVVSYKKLRYELKMSSQPSEVLEAAEYADAYNALRSRAKEVGTQLLAEFQARTGMGGNQLSLFDMLPEGDSDEYEPQGEN